MKTMKKMQDGGPADAMLKAMGKKPVSTKKTMQYVKKHGSGYKPPVKKGYKNLIDDNKWSKETASPNAQKYQAGGGYANTTPGEIAKPPMKKGGTAKKMKTGGMVNPNAKLQAGKVAGSKGVKSGVNPKAAASKVAKGRSGGTSAAPKTALPKAQYGFSTPSKPPSDSPKPTLIQPANNPLANKPKRYLAYKDGIRPTLVTKKSVGSKTRVKKG